MWAYATAAFVACVLWCAYSHWKARQPWPDFGGKAVTLTSEADWAELVETAAAKNMLILVDCYAHWCPPCRRAAPVFAQMSEEYSNVVFAKVDVDKVPELSAIFGVRTLPTFKLFRSSPMTPVQVIGAPRSGGLAELVSLRGWDERGLRKELQMHGARQAARLDELE